VFLEEAGDMLARGGYALPTPTGPA
jgi:hypothetical protein